jgi:hypothetical protein
VDIPIRRRHAVLQHRPDRPHRELGLRSVASVRIAESQIQIIFNTKNEVAMNLGILLAWTVLSMITITIATWLFRRYAVHKTCKELGENRMVEDGPA